MKKILCCLFVVFCFVSCHKGEESRTYIAHFDKFKIASMESEFQADIIPEVEFFEYNDSNERINTQRWLDPKDGQKKEFIAHELATKIVVHISVIGYKNNEEYKLFNSYINQVYYLSGNVTEIKVHGDMNGTKVNPIK